MKKALIIIGIIVVAFGTFVLLSPKSDETPGKVKSASQTNRFATIETEVKNGAYLIDVRTPSEYAAGHFANATNFDSTKVEAGQLPDLAKDATIYLYCHSGRRAGIVLTAMQKAGFKNVTSLGGVADVESLGGKLVTE
jgi:phage shock protein E